MAYCFQSGHPLGFAVQLRLTPELKQALINARANGEAVSLRFREEPHREAVLSVAGQEYFFSTAPQAGQVEVVEVEPSSKAASSVASVKQRLTLQRPVDSDARPRAWGGSLGLAGALQDDRRKRSAVLLDSSQRGGGVHPRVTTTTEVVTRTAPQPPPSSLGGAGTGPSSRYAGGNGVGGGAASSFRPTPGTGLGGSRPGAGGKTMEAPKPMEFPRPRSQQPGGGALAKPPPPKARTTPTPPPPDPNGSASAAIAGQLDSRPGSGGGGGSGGSGCGGGSSPVGYGSGATAATAPAGPGGGGGGSSGGGGSAVTAAVAPAAPELPRAAILAARRGDLSLVLAALLRDQPLTASSLQSRIYQAYRAAGAKLEAREYVKRVIDNCCNMSANRMHLRRDVLAREGPRLDELLSGTSPTAGDTSNGMGGSDRGRGGGGGGGRHGSAFGQGAAVKRMASCSPDPRMSPELHHQHSPGAGPVGGGGGGGRSSTEDAAATSGATGTLGGEDEDDGGSQLQNSNVSGQARNGTRQGPHGTKRHKMAGTGNAGPPPSLQRNGTTSTYGPGRSGGGGSGGLKGYDDFDDLADPAPVASAPPPPPPRDSSAGRPTGQYHAGRAAAAKAAAAAAAAAAKSKKIVVAPGGPRGLPSHSQLATSNGGSGASGTAQPQRLPPAPLRPPREAAGSGMNAFSAERSPQRAAAGSPSPKSRAAEAPAKVPPAAENATANAMPLLARRGSEDGGAAGENTCGGSESRMDTDGGRATTGAATATAVAASPDCESALDPEIQPYADLDLDVQEDDKDAEWYRSYVNWKPEPHPAVQSVEQYEQYEREYRRKFEVYDRLNGMYNEVVREADAHQAAIEAAIGPEERHRCVLALWRLGAAKWKLLEAWKQARRNLHADLRDLRDKVAEYVARQGAAAAAAPPPQAQAQLQLQPS